MPTSTAVLLVSTDPSLIEGVTGSIVSIGDLRLQVLAEVGEACFWLEQRGAALVLVHLPQGSDSALAIRLLQTATAARRPVATLVVSDDDDADQTLAFLRLGVVDCLSRPLDLNRLAWLVETLTARARYEARQTLQARARGEARQTPQAQETVAVLGDKDPFLYVTSTGMGQLMECVMRVAPQSTNLLLGGETGTGKTRLARLIHDLSPRRDKPFLAVNCAALAAHLIESELFGHVRGAFTGAERDRAGKLAEVGRGTLLLDEIDALSPVLQAKLLRAVGEGVFEQVGSNQALPFQARLIVASNRHLDREVAAGRFRSDLYYRVNVVSFYLPPLREQAMIIPALVDRLIAEFARRNGQPVRGISGVALGILQRHNWPGNIRELRNVIERAVALCPGEVIQPADLPPVLCPDHPAAAPATPVAPAQPACAETGVTLSHAKEEAEAALIIASLKKHRNNRLRAAADLGISRMTLYKKLHRYGLMNVCRHAGSGGAGIVPGAVES